MSFAFGIAAPLYEQRAHPRLLCDAADLARLREQVRDGYGARILAALREKVRPVVAEVLAAPDCAAFLPGGAGGGSGHALPFLADVAFIAALDNDASAQEAARRVLVALPAAARRQARDRLSIAYSHAGTVALAFDLAAPRLPPDERAAVATWLAAASVRETLATLTDGHFLLHAGMNIPMDGMITALLSLLAVAGEPGVPDLAAEQATLRRYLEATLHSFLGPAGYPAEDIGYGNGMATYVAPAVEAARRAGLYDAYAACPRWTKFGRAMVHFAQPWGGVLSNTGDYGADFGVTSLILPRLAQETGDATLLWLHGRTTYPFAQSGPWGDRSRWRSDFPELTLAPDFRVPVDLYSLLTLDALATPPAPPAAAGLPTQFMDPDRGIVSLRSDWTPDATFVVFDGAQRPAGAQGHAHDSGGHFSLSALGEYFAIDTGRYNIEQEHHNVVIVDGRSGHVGDGSWVSSHYQAQLAGYWPGAFVDAAEVVSSQMSDCYWAKRTLALVKGGDAPAYVFTVEDVNKANDYCEFWWLLNVHPDSRIEVHDDWATVVGATHGHRLEVHFALPAPTEYPRPHTLALHQHVQLAGSPKEYGGDQHRQAEEYRRRVGNLAYGPVFERPRLVAKVAGYNGRFLSVLLPRRRDEPPATVTRLASPENCLAVRLTFAQVEDTLIWAYEHHLLEAGDVVARGRWCVVRRERATGAVRRYAIHNGTRLEVAGRPLAIP